MKDKYLDDIKKPRLDDGILLRFETAKDIKDIVREHEGEAGIDRLFSMINEDKDILKKGVLLPASLVNKIRIGAAKVIFPTLPTEKSLVKLGNLHLQLYSRKPVFQIFKNKLLFNISISVANIPMLFLKRFVKRLYELNPNKGIYELVEKDKKHAILIVKGIYALPEYYLGMVEGGLCLFHCQPKTELRVISDVHFEIEIKW